MNDAVWINEYFRLALDASPSAQIIVDKDGVICHINEKATEVFGYALEDTRGAGIEMLVPENLRKGHIKFRNQYFSNPVIREMGTGQILYGQHKSGVKIPIEVGLVPLTDHDEVYILASVVDISERLKTEQRFQLTLEASPSGLILIDDSGKIELINSKIEETFGYSRSELIGSNIEKLVPETYRQDHPSFIERFFVLPRARPMGAGRDLYGLHKNGTEIPVEIGLNPLEMDGSIHVLASVIDNTERKEAEREKDILNSQIQHAQRMESLGILAGGTAHDFNNILAAISGNAELIEMMLPENISGYEKMLSYIKNIVRSCKRAEGLTNQMLSYAGKANISKEKVKINDIVQDMSGLLMSTIPKKITLDMYLDPGMENIEADRSQIQQVVLNLVTNASEAIGSAAGSITIRSGTELLTRSELIRYKMAGQLTDGVYQFLEVSDSGSGMPKDVVDNMFDPFFTTKFTGRGLGMASVLGIVHGHRGGIYVKSRVNNGTHIRIIFPVGTETVNHEVDLNENNRHILVVDDERDFCNTLTDMLELNGFYVKNVYTAESALALIKSNLEVFDLIVLDLNMPGMSGFDMYEELVKMNVDIKIILLSGYSVKQVNSLIVKDVDSGNNMISAFLHKPFEYKNLLEEIHKLFPEQKYN